MIMFKEEAGTYPEKALRAMAADGEVLFRKFADWKPAVYDSAGELEEYGELKFKRLACVELFSAERSEKRAGGTRSESVRWDFTSYNDGDLCPTVFDFVGRDPDDPEFWNDCRVDAYVSVPDLMSSAVRIEDALESLLDLVDGRNFDRDWDQVADEHEFEKTFADGLRTCGIGVDVDQSGRGVMEFEAKRGVKVRVTFR